MRPSPRVLLAVLLGVSLFAFPLVSPVPSPDEQLRLEVEPADADRNYTADRTYQSLSPDARALFDEAAPTGTATRPLADAPDPWATQANESERNAATSDVVERDGDLYLASPFRSLPGPSPVAVLTRLGSLAAGICLLAYAGYAALAND